MVSFAGRSPVAPAFDTPPRRSPLREFVGGLEVAHEGLSGFDGDDGAAVLPDLIEKSRNEPRPFAGVVFELPHAAEVRKNNFGLVKTRVERRTCARQLIFEGLPAEDVLPL